MKKLTLLVGLFSAAVSAASVGELFDETRVGTVFAFDEVSIPFSQNLRLVMREPRRHAGNPVVRRGESGTVDALGVQFYGSVVRDEGTGKFRMWYVAFDDEAGAPVASARWRPAYAESADGVNWVKPKLGLVEYRGSRENNLLLMEPALGTINLKVLRDEEEADPERRYKMSTHVYFRRMRRLGTLAAYASADGLRWKMLTPATPRKAEMREADLVLPAVHFEPSGGLYRWEGMFYACGQNAMNAPSPLHGRVTRMYRSADFVHWSETSSVGFVREGQHRLLGAGRSLEGEQTHEGISVWNRGRVLLGLVGLWHGAKDWPEVTIDLGLVLSNDGLHFREPAHERVFLRRGEDGAWDEGGVLQGQGFENVGEETWIYYGAWDPRAREPEHPRGGVGIAVLPRDRFGDLVVEEAGQGSGDYQQASVTSEFVTALPVKGGGAPRLFVNAEGLGPEAALRVELLDAAERPVPGYVAEVRESGFQTAVRWASATEAWPAGARCRVRFEGRKRTGIRFSALYVVAESAAGMAK